ncbi:MAG: hypothetical protein CME26_16095 [Gemmatimonadetes bacterium]|nr:hypothetical protein [Gemmatimonadota bacterium]|tara:strand:- start:6918 stop:8855 length:1938 start_codon:yes stop_codon:yes gene_type:complete
MRIERWSLEEVLTFMEHDLFHVPAFQRDPVWTTKQNNDLVDSILKDLPIGSITLGRANLETGIGVIPWKFTGTTDPHWVEKKTFIKRREKAQRELSREGDALVDCYLVLDGQQRMTALLEAFNSDKGNTRTVLFNEDAHSFKNMAEFLKPYIGIEHRSKDSKPGTHIGVPLDLMTAQLNDQHYLEERFKKTAYGKQLKNPDVFDRQFKRFSSLAYSLQKALMSRYRIPFIIAETDQDSLIEFFIRTNTGGTELDFFDLLNAKTFDKFGKGQHSDVVEGEDYKSFRDAMTKVLKDLYQSRPDLEFLKADRHWVSTRCYDVIREHPKLNNKNPLTDGPILSATTGELFADDFKKRVKQFHDARRFFLKEHLVTQHLRMPFEMMVIPLFFFLEKLDFPQEISMESRKFIWWWYWSSVFSERYSYTSNEACLLDIPVFRNVAEGKEDAVSKPFLDDHGKKGWLGLGEDKETGLKSIMTSSGFRGHFQRSILTLGLFRGDGTGTPPRTGLDIFGGSDLQKMEAEYDQGGLEEEGTKRVEVHHIFPKTYLRTINYTGDHVDSICNLMFVSRKANREIVEPPSEYLAEQRGFYSEAIKTHFVSDDMYEKLQSGYYDNRFDEFIHDRAEVIQNAIREQVGPDARENAIAPFAN